MQRLVGVEKPVIFINFMDSQTVRPLYVEAQEATRCLKSRTLSTQQADMNVHTHKLISHPILTAWQRAALIISRQSALA